MNISTALYADPKIADKTRFSVSGGPVVGGEVQAQGVTGTLIRKLSQEGEAFKLNLSQPISTSRRTGHGYPC